MIGRNILQTPLLTAAQSRAVDQTLIADGMPSTLLMENAGRNAAEEILSLLRTDPARTHVAVLCGAGNNGGDGYVVARHLLVARVHVSVFALTHHGLSPDCDFMRGALAAVHGSIRSLEDFEAAVTAPASKWLLVDALFGTGLNRALEGQAAAAVQRVEALRQEGALVVALDVPSGFSVDHGSALGAAIRADFTLTFGSSKRGLHTGSACDFAGKIRVCAIGAPISSRVLGGASSYLIEGVTMAARATGSHKGTAGRVLVIGGNPPTTGAGVLSAYAAHRAGAGLVTLARLSNNSPSSVQSETMVHELSNDPKIAIAALQKLVARATSVVFGPGVGVSPWAEAICNWLISEPICTIFDGDALTLLAKLQCAVGPRCVLTPHPLEAARLLGRGDALEVQADRFAALNDLAHRFDCTVVLKGAGTLIGAPNQATSILPFAEPSLGVAGSGDVLAGAIAARIAEDTANPSILGAVIEACWFHGRAGQRLRETRKTSRGFMASDIADELQWAMAESET